MSKIIVITIHRPTFRPSVLRSLFEEKVQKNHPFNLDPTHYQCPLCGEYCGKPIGQIKDRPITRCKNCHEIVVMKIKNIKESTKMENNKNTQLKKPQNPLEATIPLMLSSDYRERFIAEYRQLKIRHERLKAFNNKIEASTEWGVGEIPKHDCPDTLLAEQQRIMGEYLHTLEIRAQIEGVDLSKA